MIPVHISGTCITFHIHSNQISLYTQPGYYVPGSIINHDILGKIRCEEIHYDTSIKPSKIICSIIDQKSTIPTKV